MTSDKTIRFDGRVAIVTGAGNGLGRAHALGLAARGARVVVNDLGGDGRGSAGTSAVAEAVVEEIRAAGGEAMANGADVSNPEAVTDMVARTMDEWGRVDIMLNNAGITRDSSFAKLKLEDFQKMLDVHLTGTMLCSQAVWAIMREQQYGRILMTSSSSGLYGAFAQANYAAAKSGMLGLMNVLHIEGARHNIRTNMLAPWAATRLNVGLKDAGLLDDEELAMMRPEFVTPGVLFLVSEDAPERVILGAGSGSFARIRVMESPAVHLAPQDCTPETVAARFDEISATDGLHTVSDTFEQNRTLISAAKQD